MGRIKILNENKKVKLSISIDPTINNEIEKILINSNWLKKSRLIEHLLKKYIEENDNKS